MMILDIFHEYFYSFLHPFKVHRQLRTLRQTKHTMPQLRLAVWGELQHDSTNQKRGQDIVEQVGVSWFFVIIRAIYSLISINIGLFVLENYLSFDLTMFKEVFSPVSLQGQKILLLYIVGEAALYPILIWFYIKLWSVLIRFFGNLFGVEGDIPVMTEQVIGQSLVTHIFLLIPIFGDVVRYFSSIVYIFAGLRVNMRMSIVQSAIVICSPLFLLMIILLMFVAYLVALFSIL